MSELGAGLAMFTIAGILALVALAFKDPRVHDPPRSPEQIHRLRKGVAAWSLVFGMLGVIFVL